MSGVVRCGGGTFDLVTGFDVTNKEHQKEALRHIDIYTPLVIVVGPWCAAFGHWSRLNLHLHLGT